MYRLFMKMYKFVDLGSDDDYIIVDHSDDEDLSFNIKPEEKVDLGSDDDYIVVDHGGDDVSSNDVSNEEKNLASDDNSQIMDKQPVNSKSKHSNFVKSIISDVVVGETKLKPQEVKTVKGEFIDDVTELHKPSPKEDFVVDPHLRHLSRLPRRSQLGEERGVHDRHGDRHRPEDQPRLQGRKARGRQGEGQGDVRLEEDDRVREIVPLLSERIHSRPSV